MKLIAMFPLLLLLGGCDSSDKQPEPKVSGLFYSTDYAVIHYTNYNGSVFLIAVSGRGGIAIIKE